MDCINRKCNIPGDDRMVFCWLCLGNYHLKCSGLKARDADALSDKTKNIQWTCPSCRIIGIEFYNFFKSYRAEFDDIQKNFSALQEKLSKYGELFSKFTNLDNFAASPKPKRKRTAKASSISPKDPTVATPKVLDVTAPKDTNVSAPYQFTVTQPPNSEQIPNVPNNATPFPTPNPNNATPFLSSNSATYANIVSNQTSNLVPSYPYPSVDSSQNFSLNTISSNEQIPNMHPPLIPITSNSSDVTTCTNVVNQSLNVSNTVSTPKPLKIIPPRKTIFATRFALDTTVSDVEFYIRNNFGTELYNDIQIYKINARNRASFKIIVPDIIFDRLVHPIFWPKNTIVRQFIYREDNN